MSENWNKLPLDLKHDIVKTLDVLSRFALGLCSKSDLQLVTETPLSLNFLKFSIGKSQEMDMEIDGKKLDAIKIFQFSQFFKKINMNSFEIINPKLFKEHDDAFISKIVERIKLVGPIIKTRKLVCSGLMGSEFLEILKLIDPSILRDLELTNCTFNDEQAEEVVLGEHWKGLKALKMGIIPSFRKQLGPLMKMHHVELVWSDARFLMDCVKIFIANDAPLGSTFCVQFEKDVEIEQITVNPGPVIKQGLFEYHLLKMPMPSARHALLVKFYRRNQMNRISQMRAMVCGVADADFEEIWKLDAVGKGKVMRALERKCPHRLAGLE